MREKVLVTGGTGFIGQYILRELKSEFEVGCLIMEGESIEDQTIKTFRGDILSSDTLQTAVEWADKIIHAAGLIMSHDKSLFVKVNAGGTKNLLDVIKRVNPQLKLFVQFSSAAVMGPSNDLGNPKDEDSPKEPVNPYGLSKLLAENHVLESDLPYVIFRINTVYGGGSREFMDIFKLANLRLMPKLKGQEGYLNLIHAADVARILKISLRKATIRNQTFLLSDGNTYTWKEVSRIVGDLLGKTMFTPSIPSFVLVIAGLINEAYSRIMKRGVTLSFEKLKMAQMEYWVFSNKKFEKAFPEMTFTNLDQGFKQSYEWYRENGWL